MVGLLNVYIYGLLIYVCGCDRASGKKFLFCVFLYFTVEFSVIMQVYSEFCVVTVTHFCDNYSES